MLAYTLFPVSSCGSPGRRRFSLRPPGLALCTSAGRDRLAAFLISQPPLHWCEPRTDHALRVDNPMQRRRDDLVGIPLDPSPVLRIFLGYRLASRRCLQEEHPMTNRLLVIITAIVAVVGFGTATFLYEPTATKPAANPTADRKSTRLNSSH